MGCYTWVSTAGKILLLHNQTRKATTNLSPGTIWVLYYPVNTLCKSQLHQFTSKKTRGSLCTLLHHWLSSAGKESDEVNGSDPLMKAKYVVWTSVFNFHIINTLTDFLTIQCPSCMFSSRWPDVVGWCCPGVLTVYHLSVTHLMAESRAVLNCEMCITWSLIHATRQLSPPSLWPCSPALCGIALQWLSNTLSWQRTQKTHALSLWHTFCAYFHGPGHTHTAGKAQRLSHRGLPPTHSYQSQRVLCAFTDWLGSYWGERAREAGGRREMETARDRGITKRSRPRQIGKKMR